MNSTVLVAAVGALVVVCAWLAYQVRSNQRRVRELTDALESRTTELESARLQLQRQSTEDGLTAVANHEQLLEFLEREWRRARRDREAVSLVMLDLDAFRAFNRQYGRRAGDDCLRQIGRALSGIVGRAGDLVARYHRDEFAVVLSRTDAAGALQIGERVRQAVEALQVPSAKDAPAPVVTASVAVTSGVPERESAWEELDLIKAARHGLKEARLAGGNRVVMSRIERLIPTMPGSLGN
ncbi:MAG: diguanylate cyclase [Acidobacteriota bacterium]